MKKCKHLGLYSYFISSEEDLNNFIKLYNPVSCINDKIVFNCDYSKYTITHETVVHNMVCHFINKKRVFSLLEKHIEKNNISYDIILSLRVDIILKNKFDFKNEDCIYIPIGCDYRNGINDQIAYGNFDVMKKYNNIYDNMINLLEDGCLLHPETLNRENIKSLNINRFDLNYRLNR